MFHKTTLKNGLRIMIVPQKGTKAVTILVLVKTGSKYETKEISGISHLLEHLLFKGTIKRPGNLDIAEPLDSVGGAYNAFTGEDYTGYYAKVDSSHFDLALDIISDIYLNSKLDPKEMKKEKGVVIEEINMYKDNPMAHIQNLWSKLLYGDQPAGWDIAGTKKSVLGIKRADLKKYIDSQYSAINTIVCIAGAIKSEKETIQKIKKSFAKIGNKEPKKSIEVIENQQKPAVLVEYRKTDQTHFMLGFRGYGLDDERHYTLELLGLILGGMMSSRMFSSVREKLGLCYYIKTTVSADPDTGFMVTSAGVDNTRLKLAIKATLKEYNKIREKKVLAKELQKIKDHFKGKMTLSFESSDNLALFYSMQELLTGKILTPEEVYDRIKKVSADDILAVAKDVIRSKNINLALIGPVKSAKEIKDLL